MSPKSISRVVIRVVRVVRVRAVAVNLQRWRRRIAVVSCGLSLSLVDPAAAQGTLESLTILRADGSAPLHTQTLDLVFPVQPVGPLTFNFGFETDEVFGPDAFFDAFSLSFRTADDLYNLIVLTADASGVVFLPPVLGGDPNPGIIVDHRAIPSPSLEPRLSIQSSFSVSAMIPESLAGKQATFYLDLFDNGNGVRSQAWFGDLVLVPEPGWLPVVTLTGMGLLFRRRRGSTS